MGRAFLYLAVRSVLNRVRVRLQRLRQPRYLVGTVLGVLYFYMFFFRRSGRRAQPRRSTEALSWFVSQREAIETIAGAAGVIFAVGGWVFASSSRPALAFSQAEVQFLFAAPVTRRQLVHYKLLRAQVGAFFTSLIVTLATRAGFARSWMVFVGTFVIMFTASLYLTGAWLHRESLRRHGRSGLTRSGLPPALLGGALLVLVGALVSHWPALAAGASQGELIAAIGRLGASWPVRLVLLPFAAVLGPVLAAGPAEFFRALPAAMVVAALTYTWAIRSDVAFEEASAEQAERAARRPRDRAVPRAPRSTRVPFALAPLGRPEAAVVWKNLIAVGRYGSVRTLAGVLAAVTALGFVVAQGASGLAGGLARLSAVAAALTVFMGPQIARNDLRQDLAQLAVLKTWPIRGAALLRGEVLAPTILLSAIAMVFLVAAAPLSAPLATRWQLGVWDRTSFTLAGILIAAGLILTQVVIHNAMALFFPAWVQMAARRARGIEAFGQQLLMMAGLLAAMALAIVPAALVAAFAAAALRVALGFVPVLPVAGIAAAAMLVQNLFVVEALGGLLDKTDVSAVDPAE